MQLLRNKLRKIDVFRPVESESEYIGTKISYELLGFIYAEVFPAKETLEKNNDGRRTDSGAVLVARRDAGIKCGDAVAVFGETPDCIITEIVNASDHITAKAEKI